MIFRRCPQPSPSPAPAPPPRRSERAQALVELLGALPLLAFAALTCIQALLVALALVFAQSAADRAAHDMPAARSLASIPAGWRTRSTLVRDGSTVQVRVRPPVLLPGAGRLLDVRASARVVSP